MKYSCDSYLLVYTVYKTRDMEIIAFGPELVSVFARNIRSRPMHLLPVIIQRYYLNDDIVPDLDWQGA